MIHLPIFLLTVGILSPSASWYVDSVNGIDSNNGTSPATAFQTIGKLCAQVISVKTTIALARGSHWRAELACLTTGVAIVAYGSGVAPYLDGSDVISAGGWSKTAGYTNIYQASLPSFGINGGIWVSVWENNARFVRAPSTDTLTQALTFTDATPGSVWATGESVTNGTVVVYIQASDSSNPGTNGKTYEYSSRRSGIYSNTPGSGPQVASGIIVSGIHTGRNGGQNGSTVLGRFSQTFNSTMTEGNKHNFLCATGCYISNSTATNTYFSQDAQSQFVYYDGSGVPNGEGVTMLNDTATQTVANPYSSAILGHSDGSGTVLGFGLVIIKNFTTIGNVVGGFYGGQGPFVTIIGGSYSDGATVNGSNIIAGDTYLSVSGGTIINTSGDGISLFPGSGHAIFVDSATITGTTGSATGVHIGSANNSIQVTNSTFSGLAYVLNAYQSGVSVVMAGNTYSLINTDFYALTNTFTLFTSDNNTFNPTGTHFLIGASNLLFSAYQTTTGQDSHSTIH